MSFNIDDTAYVAILICCMKSEEIEERLRVNMDEGYVDGKYTLSFSDAHTYAHHLHEGIKTRSLLIKRMTQ